MNFKLTYLHLLTPLHTGGSTQDGNLVGIARESHTDFPYIPSSSIRGRLRANCISQGVSPEQKIQNRIRQVKLFGPDLNDLNDKDFVEQYEKSTKRKKLDQLHQGDIWIGDGSLLWMPVSSLSHGIIWISCPYLISRWRRLNGDNNGSEFLNVTDTNIEDITNGPIYLKDAVFTGKELTYNKDFSAGIDILNNRFMIVLPDRDCVVMMQMSLWRQVKVKLDEHKSTVKGAFRYEEAIPPDSVMYFPWGVTSQARSEMGQSSSNRITPESEFRNLLADNEVLQIGGQEALGRGFVQQCKEATDSEVQ